MYTQQQFTLHMCNFDGVQKSNYFGEELIRRTEAEARIRKLKKGKATGKDEVTREMIKGGGDIVVDWIWKLCNMALQKFVVLKTKGLQ